MIKSKYAALLNRLSDMQIGAYYATAKDALQQAEIAITSLERQLAEAQSYKADAERYRFMTSRDLDEILDQAMKENNE